MHTNAVLLFKKYALGIIRPGTKVLEIGPDSHPSTLRHNAQHIEFAAWDTLDLHSHPNLTYPNSKEYAFDIPSDSYDYVISAQVLEHVKKPWRWMQELARVTKLGGHVITIVPVSWTYHEAPVDCWRVYPEGMKALYDDAGLTTVLAQWDSLETPNYKRFFPGISRECQSRNKLLLYKVFGPFGLPVERSYDTIGIAQKPPAPTR